MQQTQDVSPQRGTQSALCGAFLLVEHFLVVLLCGKRIALKTVVKIIMREGTARSFLPKYVIYHLGMFTQSATVITTCGGVGSVVGIVVGGLMVADFCGTMTAAICDDYTDARNGRFQWKFATAAVELTCKWVGCLGGGFGTALLGAQIGGERV